MPYLFSYGTLQYPQVQQDTFGRLLEGTPESLSQHQLETVTITDPGVIASSGTDQHPIIKFTGNPADVITGTLFVVTDDEILQADAYEVADYQRVEKTFDSGAIGFVYAPAS